MKTYIIDTPTGPKEVASTSDLARQISWLPAGEWKVYVVEAPPEACPCCGMIVET